ncbi:MAG TPA: oligosaccharide flippase family protein [Solirubrobacteraceae bacterium]
MTEARFDLGDRTLREHAARGTIINAVFTIGLSLLGFLRGFVLAGLLAPDDYGIWGIILISLGTLGWLKAIGISDKYIQQEDDDQQLAFQRAFTLEAIFNTILVFLSLAAIPLIVVIYGHDEVVLPALACCLLLPAVSLQAPFWILYRKMQFARQRALQAIDPILSFVVAIAMAAAGAGYWSFVGGALAGAWAAALAAMWSSPYPLRLRFDRVTAREYVGFSWPLLVASLGGIVVAQGSILAGETAAGLAAAGAITLASSISMFTNRVDEVITSTLYPAICAVVDRTELLFESFVKSNRLALMWAMPFGFGLTLFTPDLVAFVLGDRWDGATTLLQAFGAAAAIGHLGFNWGAYFRARNDTKPIGAGSVVQAAVFVVAAVPLTLAYELDGLAAGMLLTVAAGLVVRGIYLRRLFAGFAMTPHALRALAPSVPAIAAVLLVRQAESGERTAGLAVAELAGYLALTIALTWVFERALLREAIGYVTGARPDRSLSRYERKVSSQNGEDGVIEELLRRAGAGTRWFVEFGASTGQEASCVHLADTQGYEGLFIEADDDAYAALAAKYADNPRVRTLQAFVAPDNVQALFAQAGVPPEPDVLAIDIDGIDYWVWQAITDYRPRIVVAEYNAHLDPDSPLTVPADHREGWDGTDYFGAGLGALRDLASARGYRLVHTDTTGTNAFFVRADLPGEYLPEDHVVVHPPNYLGRGIRHPRDPRGRPWWDTRLSGPQRG